MDCVVCSGNTTRPASNTRKPEHCQQIRCQSRIWQGLKPVAARKGPDWPEPADFETRAVELHFPMDFKKVVPGRRTSGQPKNGNNVASYETRRRRATAAVCGRPGKFHGGRQHRPATAQWMERAFAHEPGTGRHLV